MRRTQMSANGRTRKARKNSKPTALDASMSEEEFQHGYWYATELKEFADHIGIPSAGRLRKDELEKAIQHFIRTKEVRNFAKRSLKKDGPRDIDKGLRLDLP